MTKCFRHLSGRGRVFLVLMLVFASVVPGALHAAAMSATATIGSGDHHIGGSADHALMKHHHHAKNDHSPASHGHHPDDQVDMTDRCCPISCSLALCSLDPPVEAVFIRDSFDVEPAADFVVIALAMPERPPRA